VPLFSLSPILRVYIFPIELNMAPSFAEVKTRNFWAYGQEWGLSHTMTGEMFGKCVIAYPKHIPFAIARNGLIFCAVNS